MRIIQCLNIPFDRCFGTQRRLIGEVLNILNSRDKDIAYFYESYIPAFDTSGPTDGRLSRLVEPRALRLGSKVNF